MKKAEDFRKAFGPADAGFRTVMQKTIEGLKAEEEKKKAAWDLRRFRMPALAAAMAVVLIAGIAAGGGFHGLINRPDEIAPNGIQYTAQPIETALTQGTEEDDTGTAVSYENETEYALIQRVFGFVEHWKAAESRTDEDLDEMLKLCVPEWKEEVGDARAALNWILGDSACAGFDVGNSVSGNAGDPVRTLTCENVLLALGDKGYQKYRMEFDLCLGTDGLRYINPASIRRTMPTAEEEVSLTDPAEIISAGLEEKWSGITQELVPVNLSCEKQGLRFEVISAVIKRHEAYYVYSIRDLEGDRVNSETGYGIEVNDDFVYCSSVESATLLYEEEDHRYTFATKCMYDKALPTGDDTFTLTVNAVPVRRSTVADLVPFLKEYGKTEKGTDMPEMLDEYTTYFGRDEWRETGKVLDHTQPLNIALDENIFLTGIGWINNELHVRIHFADNRAMTAEYGYEDIRYEAWMEDYADEEGERIARLVWDDTGDGIPDWTEYVVNWTPEDADRIRLYVEVKTLEKYVDDTWAVKIPLRLVKEDPDNSGETEYEKDGLRYALHSDGTATILSNADNGQMDKVVIPWNVNGGYRVTEIGEGAFEDCTKLTSIALPEDMAYIGDRAFRGCTGLESVKFPESVRAIGQSAFEGCSGLTDILFPEKFSNGFASIGMKAFSGCNSLVSVRLPHGVTCDDAVFADCENLTSAILPFMVTGVTDKMFSGCVNLTSVDMTGGMRYIGKNAFDGCKKLYELIIPDDMMCIAEEAFKGCESLDNVVIPAVTWCIEDRAFQDCTGMKTITIQTKELEEIGEDVWKGCDEQNIEVIVDGGTKKLTDWYKEAREKAGQS